MMISKVTQVVERVECPAWIAELVDLAKYNMSVLYPHLLSDFEPRYKRSIAELLKYNSLDELLEVMRKYDVNSFVGRFLVMKDFWLSCAQDVASANLGKILDSDIRAIAKKVINGDAITNDECKMMIYYAVDQGDLANTLIERMRPDPRLNHQSHILSAVSSIRDGAPWRMSVDYADVRPYLVKYIQLSLDAFRAMNNGL